MATSATVRMYNQLNLGDCFLIKFAVEKQDAFLLIDFGSYKGKNEVRENEIAENIVKTVGNNPLIIVLTHQHKDHLSGFISAYEILKKLKNVQVWLSYLDDAKSKEGAIIREATEKYWKKNKTNKELVREQFGMHEAVNTMLEQKEGLDLYAEEQTGGAAITNLISLANKKVSYFSPGDVFDFPGLPSNSIKVYVLGPPFEKSLLTKLDPNNKEEVHELNAVRDLMYIDNSANLMLNALEGLKANNSNQINSFSQHDHFPFNKKFSSPLNDVDKEHPLKGAYCNTDNEWRRIDHDWLSEMGRLSLHMDRLTNNTSLVLAFELVDSGKVLLFVGDAQIGNWNSWFDIKFKNTQVTAEELLSRTVLYKAGHHSSHNATLLQGLNLMNEEELVIMVPVNAEISEKHHFAMLRSGMLMGYNRKSQGRVLRSDTIYHQPNTATNFKFSFKQAEEFGDNLLIENDQNGKHLFIEYKVE